MLLFIILLILPLLLLHLLLLIFLLMLLLLMLLLLYLFVVMCYIGRYVGLSHHQVEYLQAPSPSLSILITTFFLIAATISRNLHIKPKLTTTCSLGVVDLVNRVFGAEDSQFFLHPVENESSTKIKSECPNHRDQVGNTVSADPLRCASFPPAPTAVSEALIVNKNISFDGDL